MKETLTDEGRIRTVRNCEIGGIKTRREKNGASDVWKHEGARIIGELWRPRAAVCKMAGLVTLWHACDTIGTWNCAGRRPTRSTRTLRERNISGTAGRVLQRKM